MLNVGSIVAKTSDSLKPKHSALLTPRTRTEALADAQTLPINHITTPNIGAF